MLVYNKSVFYFIERKGGLFGSTVKKSCPLVTLLLREEETFRNSLIGFVTNTGWLTGICHVLYMYVVVSSTSSSFQFLVIRST